MLRLACLTFAAALLACLPAAAQKVAFINPGKSDEVYWVTAAQGMQAAAEDLGLQLEVRFTERDHTRTVEIARELANAPERPRWNSGDFFASKFAPPAMIADK